LQTFSHLSQVRFSGDQMRSLTAYVPVFNQASSLPSALRSLQTQTLAPSSIVVVDDASTDNSVDVARALGARVVRMKANRGRGAARQAAMEACDSEFVLCCDATCRLEPDFTERALRHIVHPEVAAVFGVYGSASERTLSDRWRARHLFKVGTCEGVNEQAAFATYGALVRRNAVIRVGGFDPSLRQSEDAELGERLRQAGFRVLRDASCLAISTVSNSLVQVLERYWRWHAGLEPRFSLRQYAATLAYSVKVMVRQDLQAADYGSAALSLVCPHYEAWKSWRHSRQAWKPRL
jgi:glycosyltransferase involved in cell wall biosynthesis